MEVIYGLKMKAVCVFFSMLFLSFHARGVSGAVFDGNATKVEPPLEVSEKLGGASGVTVSAWVKRNPAGLNRRNVIMHLTMKGTLSKVAFGFLADNTVRIGGRTTPEERSRSISTASVWTDGELHHIAGMIDLEKKEVKIYVDGALQELKGEIPVWDAGVYSRATGIRNTIGVGGDLKNYFHGEIKDIKVYSRALTEGEVAKLYASKDAGVIDGIPSLIFHWEGD